ncbi:MAG: aminotransferase class V-fold PLP-dependent enzyme [Saprospiraceae bacterium]|nr:aminotransferase class V-fold PLP-dependent enzyme [Saprospiraceae bacterium]MBK8671029.1 aminotransferase class V-fold PLP-dependent enzyme [Saprospiraceae bacterium]MBL0099763.1 aminotransferase class V-fold PLP-dependent enzyme [Saprospiraceae bacterium]
MTTQSSISALEQYFDTFRKNIIGIDQEFETPYGRKKVVYADWTASGRMYMPIEKIMIEKISPFVANTHTETNVTGSSMTLAYKKARHIIKKHVNAIEGDILISSNSGMTGVVNKLQRIIGIKIHEKFQDRIKLNENERPVIFVTHMEHHSNQTSWIETTGEVIVIGACANGTVDLENFSHLLEKYKDRRVKIAAITSCSNVTGIDTPYHQMAGMIHREGGYCFVDFACSAPYIDINMHPADQEEYLDAIYFSPHKFLGGPSSSGILIFNQKLYSNRVPDNPGGGTVDWTNPWGEHKYHEEIEAREDGGTPGFLQTIRVALCILLKEQMGVTNILAREHEILDKIWAKFAVIPNLRVLADQHKERLGVISFYIDGLHFNLAVKLLNDRFGIQMRGGCSCAGTYGHYLLEVSHEKSKKLTDEISKGLLSNKPGWVRMSIHPIMTDEEIDYILNSLEQLSLNHTLWAEDYNYDIFTNEYTHLTEPSTEQKLVDEWFSTQLI